MTFGQSWRTFVRALKLSYDHIGKVMLTNFVWFCVGFGPMLAFSYLPFLQNDVFFYLSIILSFITMGGAIAFVHYRMNRVILGEDTSFKDLWEGFKLFWLRGSGLLFLGVLAVFILVFNIMFSQNYPAVVFTILSGIWIWGIIFWIAMHQFVFPFLVNQDIGVFLTLKRAALIVLDNPLPSLVLLVLSAAIVVLCLILAAPILIFVASFLALLQNCFYHELMVKYTEVKEDDTIDSEGEDEE